MRRYVLVLASLVLFAGCTSEWDPKRDIAASPARTASSPDGTAQVHAASRESFAALPDRGELLAYDGAMAVRENGAYRSYAVGLSELHALHAARPEGELVLTAPDGRLIRLGYERHIEHPDGNWTWVGRDADGVDAVLTFGEKAVFGTIPNGDEEPLRLTTTGGRSWLVSVDRSRMPDPDLRAAQAGRTDYLVPPKVAMAAMAGEQVAVAEMVAASDFATKAATTIDLVLGYTNGFASSLGGPSQAVTRLNNLVEITNQAYANSQILARVRMVRSVAVNYPDNTENNDALQALTGVSCTDQGNGNLTCTPAPVPAALQPIRAARDQYGGDLVSLVRDFRAPENDGCGIAWLLGADLAAITAGDAPFGYSVISHGEDIDEGDGLNYGCRVETLAHELGHGMGQVHNSQNASGDGAHVYSHGYRETSASGFYTVMAYALPDSSQFAIRHFANPGVNYAGRPTGVANSADNTRSMNLTMPVVATFRPTVVPEEGGSTRNDVDGDGRTDLLWRDNIETRLAYWIMNGASLVRSSAISVGPAWSVLATGDLNGDGKTDVVWSDGAQLVLWTGNGFSFSSMTIRPYPPGYTFAGIGDIDGDGRDDLLWRDTAKTRIVYWIMNGATLVRSSSINVGPAWNLAAVGDLTGDGRLDLVWASTTTLVLWTGNGTGFAATIMRAYPVGWTLAGAEDVDGDGRDDLLWRNSASALFSYWIMNGPTLVRSMGFAVGSGWSIGSYGDLNGDGRADIVWVSATQLLLWTGNGNAFAGTVIGAPPPGWTMLR